MRKLNLLNLFNLKVTLFFIIIFSLLFTPFTIELAPKRELRIISSEGSIHSKITIRRILYQYALNINEEKDVIISSTGLIKLDKKDVTTNIYKLIFGAAKQFIKLGIHASYGTNESIAILSNEYKEMWFYDGIGLERNIIILKKSK